MTVLKATLALMTVWALASAAVAQTPSSPGAKVYIINLNDGAKVKSPFLVQCNLV